VGNEIDSDHQSVTVWRREGKGRKGEGVDGKNRWSEEARRKFEERTEGIKRGREELRRK